MRILSTISALAGVLLAGLFAFFAFRTGTVSTKVSTPTVSSPSGSYHAGKGVGLARRDSVCQKEEGCHPSFRHGKDTVRASYVDAHIPFVECLACHGQEAESKWVAGEVVDGRKVLRFGGEIGSSEPHKVQRKPIGCRECHSAGGQGKLTARGYTPSAWFDNPIVLRMLEGEPRRWSGEP